jgi:hypothetical protein
MQSQSADSGFEAIRLTQDVLVQNAQVVFHAFLRVSTKRGIGFWPVFSASCFLTGWKPIPLFIADKPLARIFHSWVFNLL